MTARPYRPGRHLRVKCGGVELGVAEQRLDDADVDTVLEQVRGKAVAQGVWPDPLGDIRGRGGLDDDAIQLSGAERHHRVLAGEEPAIRAHDAQLSSGAPPVPKQHQQALGQHGVAIATALAAFDAQQHALAVDVAHLESRDLGDAQASAIGDRQRRLVLETRRGIEQSLHLLKRQHDRDLAGMGCSNQLAREVGPIKCVGEEEPKRRDDAVHGRRRNPGISLLDLEQADILCRRGMRRSSQPRREPADVADIVALRLARKPAQGHVIDQTLTKRTDRKNG